jgi:hypothetical protein
MEDLINNAHVLFDDRQREGSTGSAAQSTTATANTTPAASTTTLNSLSLSHALPPAPRGEEAASVNYGSAYTHVGSVPPRRRGASDSNILVPSASESGFTIPPHFGRDFAPQLPPRPGNSIHPSRRAAGQQGNSRPPVLPDSPDSKRSIRTKEETTPVPLPNPFPEPRSSIDSSISRDATESILSNGDEDGQVLLGTPGTDETTFASARGTPTSPLSLGDEQFDREVGGRKSYERPRSSLA